MKHYDLAVIGAGPAGLSTAINGASDGLKVALFDTRKHVGGQAYYSSAIENVLGWPDGITGEQLAARAYAQALKFRADIYTATHIVEMDAGERCVRTDADAVIYADCLVLAMGLEWRRLDAGEGIGGVYYGAGVEDAYKHVGEDVVIVGGANSAGQAAVHWAQYARSVTLLVRSKQGIRAQMSAYLAEKIERAVNVRVVVDCVVRGCVGMGRLTAIETTQGRMECTALVVFIGAEPRTQWVKGVELNERGFVVADASYRTNVPGVFAVGDVRCGLTKRVSAAIGDGGRVITHVYKFREGLKVTV